MNSLARFARKSVPVNGGGTCVGKSTWDEAISGEPDNRKAGKTQFHNTNLLQKLAKAAKRTTDAARWDSAPYLKRSPTERRPYLWNSLPGSSFQSTQRTVRTAKHRTCFLLE